MGNVFRKAGQLCGCSRKQRSATRTVYLGGKRPPIDQVDVAEVEVPQKFPTNKIISSKYTKWSFLPKNLFEQFRRIANFYFLLVAIVIVLLGNRSPVTPWTSIIPLVFVITVTGVKQGYEDWLRHKADNEVNNREASILKNGELVTVKAQDIKVGDVIRVSMNRSFPCDMVMLSSNEEDGECSVTTANLDGETNLKTFYSLPETRSCQSPETLSELCCKIECEQPVTDLYRFLGRMHIYNPNGEETLQPLAAENVLLRGGRLKNTHYVYGCAVYTGQETKISLNSKYTSAKFSRVEKAMNRFLIGFLITLFLEAGLLTGLKHGFQNVVGEDKLWYVSAEPPTNFLNVLVDFLSFMVLINYIIPISMYVTVELQKFFGSMFFAWDAEMYDVVTNEPAKANTSDLNEELGQVEYLFTDKTGTLTENDMQFRHCTINGTQYTEHGGMLCYRPDVPGCLPQPVNNMTPEIEQFLTVLALCHTCRVDRKDNLATGAYSESGFEYEYQASSPDEKAFLEACRRYGIVYHGVRDDRVEVTFRGQMKRYKMYHVMEFDPTRKRMSVIVQDEDGSVFLLVKGAESAIFEHVVEGNLPETEKQIKSYAVLGLRALVIAMKKLTEEEFTLYDSALKDARNSLDNREENLSNAFEMIERNLVLLGATAVEDRLQEGVPETLESLREAGIKVWVLTGDKEETAINISHSAGHFKANMTEIYLTKQSDTTQCEAVLKELLRVLKNSEAAKEDEKFALVIDGVSLRMAIADHYDLLQDMCSRCTTVLCCRMSPLQKAQVVRLIKTLKSDPVTAAIGDGANDVSMIQEAHVGLGIMGKEGRQAVRCSDYAFGRFRFLKRALLVHGHYFYIRIALLVQYFFYKNVAFITAQVYFAFFSAFSAQPVFDGFLLMFYNITCTSLPILITGLFEQHIKQRTLLKRPELYKNIRKNARLTAGQFSKWNLLGFYHSLVFFFGTYLAVHHGSIFPDGQMYGNAFFGTLIYTTCVFTVNIKLMLETYYWCIAIHASYLITFVGYFGLTIFYNSFVWYPFFNDSTLLHLMYKFYATPACWIIMLLLMIIALLPDIIMKSLYDTSNEVYRARHITRQSKRRVSFYETNKMSISFTKRSATLTISESQTNIIEG